MNYWYSFRSKNRKVRGYCPARDEEEVARFAGYPVEELVIEPIRWNGKEFLKCKSTR